jgi:hypothetical protein
LSPTVFKIKSYRFFFFSREEPRLHVHVACPDGEAKYWLEPKLELAQNTGIPARRLREIVGLIQEHKHEIKTAWQKHFRG